MSAQGYQPIKEWIVIEPRDAFASEGELVLPQAYDDEAHGSNRDMIRERNRNCFGIVRAVGPGYRPDSPKLHKWADDEDYEQDDDEQHAIDHDVRVGMQVMYDRASATKIEGTDPMLVIVRAHGILCVVEGHARPVVGGLVSVE